VEKLETSFRLVSTYTRSEWVRWSQCTFLHNLYHFIIKVIEFVQQIIVTLAVQERNNVNRGEMNVKQVNSSEYISRLSVNL
jgi:hypothetical protein